MAPVSRENEHRAVVARLWQEHLDAKFPAGLRGAELMGIDMVMLDADVAGCVSAWRANSSALDPNRRRILHNCIADLDMVLPVLTTAEDFRYYQRLRHLAVLTSEAGS
ncbi:hypothetical protein [Streptomyces sp. NPDC014006]|uniref:hypothetical protein n=1 Tax=Streptomyces sp. NPDC014006 TaxID=3364870 RepID=UPI0036F9CA56